MLKTRIVPEHKETYKVCDECGEEITDYSYMVSEDNKHHWHSMYAGGSKGQVKKTCNDIHNEKLIVGNKGER